MRHEVTLGSFDMHEIRALLNMSFMNLLKEWGVPCVSARKGGNSDADKSGCEALHDRQYQLSTKDGYMG